jgi:hypothetical protein
MKGHVAAVCSAGARGNRVRCPLRWPRPRTGEATAGAAYRVGVPLAAVLGAGA